MVFNYTKRLYDLEKTIRRTVRLLCIVYTLQEYVVNIVITKGKSMEPSILSGDVLITEKLSAHFFQNKLKKGDIVNFIKPGSEMILIKRITGTPNESIITNISSFGYSNKNCILKKFNSVPPGHLWMEGDNRDISIDSRIFGPVPMALLKGRSIAIIWPLSRRKFL
mmetsp:Transcript_840/g.1231  ORF Transcript_840/g.1231 Transcript_840/m.1231 type:complete len:166 (-) Transcript_840:23-520(-)